MNQLFEPPTHKRNRPPLIEVHGVSLWYGDKRALEDVSLDLYPGEILALMGPSGCGKSTLLKCLNRMHDDTRGVRMSGTITLDGKDIFGPDIDPPLLRRRFGWVAQKPNPFASSIRSNILYPAKLHGLVPEGGDDMLVEDCLRRVDLWEEVKDRLGDSGTALSGGQQQRLCIARALATDPDVMLMDEPCGSIDPIATARIEDLIHAITANCAVIVITHSMAQARRLSDRVAFFYCGRMVEVAPTARFFAGAHHPEAQRYLAGAFG